MKVFAIYVTRTNKETGRVTETLANSAVWRNRYDALAECRRQLEEFSHYIYESIIETNTRTGKQTVIGYKWSDGTRVIEYMTCEWPVY